MALHGVVRVNTDEIGWYEIQRLEKLSGLNDVHRYRYEVHFPGQWSAPVAGELSHRYSAGAAVLVAMAMMAANARADRLAGIAHDPGRNG